MGGMADNFSSTLWTAVGVDPLNRMMHVRAVSVNVYGVCF